MARSPFKWALIIIGLAMFWYCHGNYANQISQSTLLLLVHYAAICLSLVFISFRPTALVSLRFSLSPSAICLMYFFAIVGFFETDFLAPTFEILASMASGVSFAFLTCVWISQILLVHLPDSGHYDFIIVAGATAISSAMSLVNVVFAWHTSMLLIVLLYSLSAFIYVLFITNSVPRQLVLPTSEKKVLMTDKLLKGFDRGLGFIFLVFGALYGLRHFGAASTGAALAPPGVVSSFGSLFGEMLLLIITIPRKKMFEPISLFPIVPLFATIGVLIFILDFAPEWLGHFLYSFAHILFYIFIAVFILRSARLVRLGTKMIRLIGLNRLLVELGTLCGVFLAWLAYGTTLQENTYGQLLAVFFILLLLISATLIPKKQYLLLSPTQAKPTRSVDFEVGSTCEKITQRFNLSAREAEVLYFLVQGWPQKKIAETLLLAPSTIKSHTRHIYEKLGINNKSQLIDIYRSMLVE